MARAPNPNINKAYELYKKGYKLIEISKKLNIPDGTVRRWKKTYNWEGERSNKKTNVQNKKQKTICEVTNNVIENTELTDKQKLFCILYSKSFNATKSYLKSYKCTYDTAGVEGHRLLKKPKIKAQINSLIAPTFNKEILSRGIIQKYIDIAFSDIGDYVKFGRNFKRMWGKDENGNDVPIIDPETGEQKIYEYNYLELKESSLVDTTLISEISEGKDGIKFKLADKMKALDFLNKHCNLLNDEEKTQLDIENKKLQNAKLQAEINMLSEDDIESNTESDGFIEALEDKASDVWSEE